jgi:hypothetical protein
VQWHDSNLPEVLTHAIVSGYVENHENNQQSRAPDWDLNPGMLRSRPPVLWVLMTGQEVLTAVSVKSMQTCRSLPNVLEWPAVSTFRFLRNAGNIYQTTRPTILPGVALTDLTAVCSNRIPNHGNSTASASTMPTVTLRAEASQPSAHEISQGTAPRTDSRPPKYHCSGNTGEKTYPMRNAYAHTASQSQYTSQLYVGKYTVSTLTVNTEYSWAWDSRNNTYANVMEKIKLFLCLIN